VELDWQFLSAASVDKIASATGIMYKNSLFTIDIHDTENCKQHSREKNLILLGDTNNNDKIL
jgi:hypothetical protein